jgi:hypothetical protein
MTGSDRWGPRISESGRGPVPIRDSGVGGPRAESWTVPVRFPLAFLFIFLSFFFFVFLFSYFFNNFCKFGSNCFKPTL